MFDQAIIDANKFTWSLMAQDEYNGNAAPTVLQTQSNDENRCFICVNVKVAVELICDVFVNR